MKQWRVSWFEIRESCGDVDTHMQTAIEISEAFVYAIVSMRADILAIMKPLFPANRNIYIW